MENEINAGFMWRWNSDTL